MDLRRVSAPSSQTGEFQATENSISAVVKHNADMLDLSNNQLVIDLGRRWELEMVDFNQLAARHYAVKQLRTMPLF